MKRFLTFFLISFFILIPNVFADTYYINTEKVTFKLWLPSGGYNSTGTTDTIYTNNEATNYYGFTQEIWLPALSGENYPNMLYAGQYLIEFYIYSDYSTLNPNSLKCFNIESNFTNVNITTGNWVSNEIDSQCIDTYQTTYNSLPAVRVLYKFTYNGGTNGTDGIDQIRFNLNSSPNDWFNNGTYGFKYGLSSSNIYDYDSSIVTQFQQFKQNQTSITQNQTIIDQNGTIINQNNSLISEQSFGNKKLEEQLEEQKETNDKLDDLNEQNRVQIEQGDAIIDRQNQTNDKLDDLNDNLTNTDGPSLSALENSAGWLPAGPIDSILNLPLSLLNNISSNLSKQCQPVVVTLPFVHTDFTLPCLNTIYSQIGGLNTFLTTIGVIASAFLLFSYLLKLYRWVDDTLSFRENNEIDNWGGI